MVYTEVIYEQPKKMLRFSMFSETKFNLNHTVLGVHRLDNVEEVQWGTGVAHAFCQRTAGGLAISCHSYWTGE